MKLSRRGLLGAALAAPIAAHLPATPLVDVVKDVIQTGDASYLVSAYSLDFKEVASFMVYGDSWLLFEPSDIIKVGDREMRLGAITELKR